MNRKITLLLACLALAGCAPVIPVPVQDKTPCECTIDEVTLHVPVPDYVWQEMLDEYEEALQPELSEYPAADK